MTDKPLSPLPPGFADLSPFADHWARRTENERSAIRWLARPADFAAFYGAVMPRLPEILTVLDACPAGAVPDDLSGLYYLACAFAEASPHHELYGGSPDVPHSFDARRFRAMHGDQAS